MAYKDGMRLDTLREQLLGICLLQSGSDAAQGLPKDSKATLMQQALLCADAGSRCAMGEHWVPIAQCSDCEWLRASGAFAGLMCSMQRASSSKANAACAAIELR